MSTTSNQQETIALIRHIAAELYNPIQSRMSVFIGAGFSKNADPQMPTWNDLGKLFAQKLGITAENQHHNPQSIMEMADQTTLIYGRATLNQIIKASTIETQNSYNDLHVTLTKQPWRDIFTTNYDRYIEDAAVTTPGIAYQTIVHPNQLVGSSSPRIIKLHGCISTEEYIISSEDYRKYPDKFAPFVNTVRQALIETSCCLIGFSGNDPNFKSWIGWVRDVLGKHQASKIYLISVKDTYTEAQKHLLAQQNIIVVDISVLTTETTYFDAIKAFFDELSKYQSNYPLLNVPVIEEKEIHIMIKEFTYKIQEARASYPGWLYIPSDYRSRIQMYTLNHILNVIHNNPTENFQQLLPDLAWILNTCLMPLSNEILALFQNYIDNSIKLERVDSALLQPIIQLLLRHYRHTNKSTEWNSVYEIAKNLAYKELDIEAQNLLYTENILQKLYQLNISNILTLLEDWPKVTTPYWQSRRAMLYAHFGDFVKASTILNQELERLRIEINTFQTAKQKHAMDLFTYEAIILFCLVSVERMLRLQTATSKKHTTSYDLYLIRSLYLRQYRIDIENEINLFESRITNNDYKNATRWIRRTTNTLYDDDVNVTTYEYLTFLERVGITFPVLHTSINESAYLSLLHHLNRYFPYAATIYSLHSNNRDINIHIEMKPVFLHNLANDLADILCQNALQSCNSYTQKTSISRPPATYPAILAQLVTKAHPNVRNEIFNFLKITFTKNNISLFNDLHILIQSFMQSISPTELQTYAADFVNWEFQASTRNSQLDNRYWHPFMYLTNNQAHFHKENPVEIEENTLKDIIAHTQFTNESKRHWYSMVVLSMLKHDIYSQPTKEFIIKHLPIDTSSTLPKLSVLGSNLIPLAHQWNDTPINAATNYLEAILTGNTSIINGNADDIAEELVNVLWQLRKQNIADYSLYDKTCNKLFEHHQAIQKQDQENTNPFRNIFYDNDNFYNSLYYTTLFIFIPVLDSLSEITKQQITQINNHYQKSNPQRGMVLKIAYKIKTESVIPTNEIFQVLFQLQTNNTNVIKIAIDLFRALFIYKLPITDILADQALHAFTVWLDTCNISSMMYWIKSIHEFMYMASFNTESLPNFYTKLLPSFYEVTATTIRKSYELLFNEHEPVNQSMVDEITFLYKCSLFARKSYDIYKITHPQIKGVISLWYVRSLGPNTNSDYGRPLRYNIEELIWNDVQNEFYGTSNT